MTRSSVDKRKGLLKRSVIEILTQIKKLVLVFNHFNLLAKLIQSELSAYEF